MSYSDDLHAAALAYHRLPRPGKLEIQATKPLANQRDLALAYSPGVASACTEIAKNPAEAATLTARANLVAVVSNGTELSSGAIRNHRPDVMKKAFAIAGYPEDVLEAKFGGMLRALSLGAPPHGGIAPGIDRIVMLLCGEENLREVVLFPMNQRAEDLMMGAPSEVTPKQLRELHIRLNLPQN